MQTLADLVARDRRSDAPALLTDGRVMDYRRFCTTVWKASNYLRHLGVADDRGVVVLADASAPPVLTFFGAALLDVPTRFVGETSDVDAAVADTQARAVLVPASEEDAVETRPGTTLVIHGADPSDPATGHWESGVWSENPAFVPSSATPDSVALRTEAGTVSHGDLVVAATAFATDIGLDDDDAVGVRAPLSDPRVVAAGVVAPLSVGGAVRLGTGDASVTVGHDAAVDYHLDAVDL